MPNLALCAETRLVFGLRVSYPQNSLSPRRTGTAGHPGPGFSSHELIKRVIVAKLSSQERVNQ